MPDFRSRLEQELVQAAGRPHRVRYAGAAIPGPRALAAGAVALAILASASILGNLRSQTHGDEVAATASGPTSVRAFDAPTGTGYVEPSDGDGGLCITIPDPVEGFGTACQSAAVAKKRGVLVAMQDAASDGLIVAFALPADTTVRALAADGMPARTQTTTDADGIFAGVVPFGTVFEVSGPQGSFKQTLPRRAPTDFSCHDVKNHLGEPLDAC